MPELVSFSAIWDRAPHNAFTDLALASGVWYCVFREGGNHAGGTGKIRVLRSDDGNLWESAALVAQRGVDLRDPKISGAPRGGLELLMGGTAMRSGEAVGRRPRIVSSDDGVAWTKPQSILEEGDWLWRTAWFEGRSYGVSYRLLGPSRWKVYLMASEDGHGYRELAELKVPGRPNETTLRFRGDGTALALVRRETGRGRAWIGSSRPPYRDWSWTESSRRVGGPNFLILPDGATWAATRIWRRGKPGVSICRMTESDLEPVLDLPSGGDCGYPGMVFHRGMLWASYYSSHEGKARIYLAKIRL
ncbi:MAG TPA: sialidase family protein [Rectinemataceae bacterium]|nr:sialidase family protein [Rectinemataceae bacterium]